MTEKQETKKTHKKNITKFIAGGISAVILVFALIIFTSVMIARAQHRTPTVFGYSFHIVATASMQPEINIKDLVIAKAVPTSAIKVGDDIVFISADPNLKGMQIVHRVVAINPDGGFVTKGINNDEQDAYPTGKIIGKVTAVSGGIGRALSAVGSNKNILFMIVLIIIFIVIGLQLANVIVAIKSKKLDDHANAESTQEANLAMRQELTQQIKKELQETLNSKDKE